MSKINGMMGRQGKDAQLFYVSVQRNKSMQADFYLLQLSDSAETLHQASRTSRSIPLAELAYRLFVCSKIDKVLDNRQYEFTNLRNALDG